MWMHFACIQKKKKYFHKKIQYSNSNVTRGLVNSNIQRYKILIFCRKSCLHKNSLIQFFALKHIPARKKEIQAKEEDLASSWYRSFSLSQRKRGLMGVVVVIVTGSYTSTCSSISAPRAKGVKLLTARWIFSQWLKLIGGVEKKGKRNKRNFLVWDMSIQQSCKYLYVNGFLTFSSMEGEMIFHPLILLPN